MGQINMSEENIKIIQTAIDNLATAYGYLVEGPLYVESDMGLIKYHETERESDMQDIKNSVFELNKLLEIKKSEVD